MMNALAFCRPLRIRNSLRNKPLLFSAVKSQPFSFTLSPQNSSQQFPASSSRRISKNFYAQYIRTISYSAFRDGDNASGEDSHPDNHHILQNTSLLLRKEMAKAANDHIPKLAPDAPPINSSAIEFREKDHVYLYQGKEIPFSVTQVIASYFPYFNKDEAIARMMQGDNWPRPEYTHPNGISFTKVEILQKWASISAEASALGTKMHAMIEAFFQSWNATLGFPSTNKQITDKPLIDTISVSNVITTVKSLEMKPEREKQQEKPNIPEKGMSYLTEILSFHTNNDGGTNALEEPLLRTEWQQLQSFVQSFLLKQNIAVLGTEMRLVAPDLGIAGSVDFVGRIIDPTRAVSSSDVTFAPGMDRVVLIDWKRSKDLAQSAFHHYQKKGKGPWGHIPACDGYKYALQVNLYRYILQRYYQLRVEAMYIVSLHPDQRLPPSSSLSSASLMPEAPPAVPYFYEEQPLLHVPGGAVTSSSFTTCNSSSSSSSSSSAFGSKPEATSSTPTTSGAGASAEDVQQRGFYVMKVADLQEEIELMLQHHMQRLSKD
jgi:hypothetical protein